MNTCPVQDSQRLHPTPWEQPSQERYHSTSGQPSLDLKASPKSIDLLAVDGKHHEQRDETHTSNHGYIQKRDLINSMLQLLLCCPTVIFGILTPGEHQRFESIFIFPGITRNARGICLLAIAFHTYIPHLHLSHPKFDSILLLFPGCAALGAIPR